MTLGRSATRVAERRSAVVALGAGLAAAALVVAGAPATAGAADAPAPLIGAQSASAVAGEYLVVLRRGVTPAGASRSVQRAEAAGGKVERQFTHALDGYAATLSADELADVREDPSVAYVEAVQRSAAEHRATTRALRVSTSTQSAGAPIRNQATQSPTSWNLDRIDQRPLKLDNRYVYGPTGTGVTAYVVGSGIDPAHPDFGTRVRAGVNVSGDGLGTDDCFGVSTATSDLIGGRTYGVAKGVALTPVKIVPCTTGVSDTTGFVAAMDWIIADHEQGTPAVADLEDWYQKSSAVDAAVTALIADGVTAVALSGQPASGATGGSSACSFSPGHVPAVVTVGAVNWFDQRDWRYSHYGSCIDLWAPGINVQFSLDGETPGVYEPYYGWGTWFAAPHVSGTAANYLQTHPVATPAQVAAAVDAATTRGALTLLGTGSPNKLVYALPADPPARTPDAHAVASGTGLRKGETITSPNGFYTLRQQTDGNVVLTRGGGRLTWALGRKGSWLTMRADGNLVAYDFGRPMWSSGTAGNGSSDLRVQDDGNLVVYRRSDNKATWASRTSGKLPPPQPTTASSRLAPGQGLVRGLGTYLQSPNARYRAFVHTSSGRLVVRDQTTGTYVFRTPAVDSDWLLLQTDGNLVLYTRTGTALWASGTGGKGLSDLVMQNDGNLVLYLRSTGKATWSSKGGRV